MSDLIALGRKKGFYVLGAVQTVSQIPEEIIAQVKNFIFFGAISGSDLDIIAHAMNTSPAEIRKLLSTVKMTKLPDGRRQCILWTRDGPTIRGRAYPPAWIPGAVNESITQENIKDTICSNKWTTRSIRPPTSYTNRIKKAQLEQMESEDRDLRNFEEDHLISLQLGGHPTDIRNLFPEPYHTKINGEIVGALQKDRIETLLNQEVCKGTITLKRAQEIISTDWYACFLKYKNKLECL